MARYFNKFPTINYKISTETDDFTSFEQITDITVRIGVIQTVLNNTADYYDILLRDGDTPDIVADKFYGDSEAHWLVMLTNKIIDPDFDWMLDQRSFDNYIVKKYGSIEWAQTNWHHWEKVISRTDSRSRETSVQRIWIDDVPIVQSGGWSDGTLFTDGTTFSDVFVQIGDDNVPYDSYLTMAEAEYNTYNLGDGTTVDEVITRERVTYYDWENDINESHRAIKLIRSEYWPLIKEQFNAIMTASGGNEDVNYGLRYFR